MRMSALTLSKLALPHAFSAEVRHMWNRQSSKVIL